MDLILYNNSYLKLPHEVKCPGINLVFPRDKCDTGNCVHLSCSGRDREYRATMAEENLHHSGPV